jgi:hypothetical protein
MMQPPASAAAAWHRHGRQRKLTLALIVGEFPDNPCHEVGRHWRGGVEVKGDEVLLCEGLAATLALAAAVSAAWRCCLVFMFMSMLLFVLVMFMVVMFMVVMFMVVIVVVIAMQQAAAAVVLVCVAQRHVGQDHHWWRGCRHFDLKHSLQSMAKQA